MKMGPWQDVLRAVVIFSWLASASPEIIKTKNETCTHVQAEWMIFMPSNESSLFAGRRTAGAQEGQSSVAPHIRQQLLLKLYEHKHMWLCQFD